MADMRLYRIYIDASVVGGCLDDEFSSDSLRLIDAARLGRVILLVSDVLVGEINQAPTDVQDILPALPDGAVSSVAITEEVNALRDAYLDAGIVGRRWLTDATHVAAATVARADAIVSWNFRHIVHLDKIKAYNSVNLVHGYGMLTILTPAEVRFDESDTEQEEV